MRLKAASKIISAKRDAVVSLRLLERLAPRHLCAAAGLIIAAIRESKCVSTAVFDLN
jgi:hypothetical protein